MVRTQDRPSAGFVALIAACLAGCSSEADVVRVHGQVTMNGVPVSAEIAFEPILEEGAGGRSATVFAGSNGNFTIQIPRPTAVAGDFPCRILIRVTGSNSDGVPTAFDFASLREKTVTLRRVITDDSHFNFCLTR